MTESPLVSVVIPVYNGVRHLGQALQSVLEQTYDRMEILVVDDGSDDGSGALANEFAAVRVLTNPHLGVSHARNSGVEASSGDFIAFLDADDTWYPDRLLSQVALASDQAEVDVVMALQDYRFDGPIPPWFRGPTDGSAEPGFLPSSWLVRRQCWDRVGLFNTALSHGEDMDWLARAREMGATIATAPEVLVTRRIHDGNLTGLAEESRNGLFTALRMSVNRKREGSS